MEVLVKMFLALFGVFVGSFITRILDRGRPLLVIEAFSTATKSSEPVNCTKEISDLTKKSWFIETIQIGDTNWGDLEKADQAAVFELDLLLKAEEKSEKIIALIDSSDSIESMNDAIKEIFKNPGLQSHLEMSVLREKVRFDIIEYANEPKLNGIFHPDRDGCLALVFDNSVGKMGRKLKIDEWRKDKLLPLFTAMQHHDKEPIKKALASMEQYAREQRDVHSQLKELLTPLREDETVWLAKCSIINFGRTPIVIQPTGLLEITSEEGKRLPPVPCYIATKIDGKDDATDLIGPQILAPEKELDIWVITKNKKSKMNNGNRIEGLYKDENATASVVVDIVLPHLSFVKTVKSKKYQFKNTN